MSKVEYPGNNTSRLIVPHEAELLTKLVSFGVVNTFLHYNHMHAFSCSNNSVLLIVLVKQFVEHLARNTYQVYHNLFRFSKFFKIVFSSIFYRFQYKTTNKV